jgi:membrane protease YdiL (CAAX protease family)
VLVPAILGASREAGDAAILPTHVPGVLLLCFWQLASFGAVFLLAAWLARLGPENLRLRWRGGWWVVPRAIGWSIVLRFGVGMCLAGAIVLWRFLSGASLENLAELRPEVESIVDVSALNDPLYLITSLTVVSFLLAGLPEELWRAGMLALLAGMFPRLFAGRFGPWLAIIPVALLFGLGHTPQGLLGVIATALLGMGLGAVMLIHRSTWDAVLAHGFFNAGTFAMLPWLADRFPELLG